MVAVSGALIFSGYQLSVYGWSQVNGANAGFFDILWPGRYTGNKPDSGAGILDIPGLGLNDTAAGGTIGKATPLMPGTIETPSGLNDVGAGGTIGR